MLKLMSISTIGKCIFAILWILAVFPHLIVATHKIDPGRDSDEIIGAEVNDRPLACSRNDLGRILCTLEQTNGRRI